VTVNTSTILPTYLNSNQNISRTANINAPFYRAAASSTISIGVTTGGSLAGWISGVRFPIISKVEMG